MLQKLGSIATHIIFTRGYITVMDLSEYIHMWGFYFLNINIIQPFVNLVTVFASFLSIPSSVEMDFKTCSLPVALMPLSLNNFVYHAWNFYPVLLPLYT